MNGTVTLSQTITGIEAISFNQAVQKVKSLPGMVRITNLKETENELSGEFYSPNGIITYLSMDLIPLNVI